MRLLFLSMTILFPSVFASAFFSFASNNPQASASHQPKSESHLLETGRASTLRPAIDSRGEVKVVSYNIRWRGGEELRQLAQLLKDDAEIGGAAILGLQEIDRNKKRTGNKNTVKMLAEELGIAPNALRIRAYRIRAALQECVEACIERAIR